MATVPILWILLTTFHLADSQVNITSTSKSYTNGNKAEITCHVNDFNDNVFMRLNGSNIVSCVVGFACNDPGNRYNVQRGPTTLSLKIISFNDSLDSGNWLCMYGITSSLTIEITLSSENGGNGGNSGDNCVVPIIIGVFFAVSLPEMLITCFVALLLHWKCPHLGRLVIIVPVVVIDGVVEIILLWGIEYAIDFKFFRSDSECNVVLIGVVCHLGTLLFEVVKASVLYRYMNKSKTDSKPTEKVQNNVVDPNTSSSHLSKGSKGRSPLSAEDRTEKEAKPEDVMILMHFPVPEGYSVDTWATEKTSSINDTSKYRPSDRGSLCIKAATKTDNGIYQSILKSNDSEQRINAVLHVTEQKSVSLVIHPLIWRRLSSKKLKKMSELKNVRHKLSTKKIDDIEIKKEDKSNVFVKSVRWKHNGRGIPSNFNNDDNEVPPLEVIKNDPTDEYHCTVEFSNKKSHVYIFIVKFTEARSGNTQSSTLAKNKVDTTEDVIGVPTIMNIKSADITPGLPPIRHTGTTAPANQNPESSPIQGSDLHPVTARSAQSTTEDNT